MRQSSYRPLLSPGLSAFSSTFGNGLSIWSHASDCSKWFCKGPQATSDIQVHYFIPHSVPKEHKCYNSREDQQWWREIFSFQSLNWICIKRDYYNDPNAKFHKKKSHLARKLLLVYYNSLFWYVYFLENFSKCSVYWSVIKSLMCCFRHYISK